MITTTYDSTKPYAYVRYGRMSSDMQNPRSPEQQFDTIEATLRRSGYSWSHRGDYRDDGKSGRYVRKRTGFCKMLEDILLGRVTVDLVLVDTLERFGRMDELDTIRRELRNKHGVLVLTADSGFADPTSVAGQALGAVESIRSRSDAHAKAHNVRRGKIDAAKRKHWPGGPVPLGYRLRSIMKEGAGPAEVDYRVLEPDPESAPHVCELFRLAAELGWGTTRIARQLNGDSEFVGKCGKISASRVGFTLDNPIYKGVFRFGRVATDVVDDRRVQRRNCEDEVLYIEDFCTPMIDPAMWDKVRAMRQARGQQMRDIRAVHHAGNGKQITPLAPGIVLKYPLTGLVRCGLCGATMQPSKSGAKSPFAASYYYYRCPVHVDKRCDNKIYLPGNWLWQTVVTMIREHLFPMTSEDGSTPPAWLGELVEQVRIELLRSGEQDRDRRPLLEQELADLDKKIQGWSQSLASPNLSGQARQHVEQELNTAVEKKQQVEIDLQGLGHHADRVDELVDTRDVLDRLERLDQVLASDNPTEVNNELLRHIDSILVYPEGRVVVRCSRLGLFGTIGEVMAGSRDTGDDGKAPQDDDQVAFKVRQRSLPKRKARGRLGAEKSSAIAGGLGGGQVAVPDEWAIERVFVRPKLLSWAEAHALEVAELRATGLTIARLAEHFDKTPPTIRSAMQHAVKMDESVARLPRKMPRANWAKDHAAEVAKLKTEGMSTVQIAERFNKSDTTIREALKYAREVPGAGEYPAEPHRRTEIHPG